MYNPRDQPFDSNESSPVFVDRVLTGCQPEDLDPGIFTTRYRQAERSWRSNIVLWLLRMFRGGKSVD